MSVKIKYRKPRNSAPPPLTIEQGRFILGGALIGNLCYLIFYKIL